MKCAKRDIFLVIPRKRGRNFSIDLSELRDWGVENVIRDDEGIGRFVPYCNCEYHKGIISNGLVYLCQERGCSYFRRYLGGGIGSEITFSTDGDIRKVKPYSREVRRSRRSRN